MGLLFCCGETRRRVRLRGDDETLDDPRLVRLAQRRIDAHALHLAFGGELHGHEAAACLAFFDSLLACAVPPDEIAAVLVEPARVVTNG